MNLWTITGRLGRDPETRMISSGDTVTSFSVAVDRGKDKDPLWVKVTAWRKLGELCAQYLSKGRFIVISGRAGLDEWDGRDGQRKSQLTMDASLIDFGPREGGQQRDEGSDPQPHNINSSYHPSNETDDIPF